MPKGAALSEGSSGENISHFASLRIRVVGQGALKMSIFSLDDVRTKTLVPLQLSISARIIPTRLINFTEQRASIEFKTTEINEKFRINRIVVYLKEVATSYPGN